ncbi:MAG: PilZ domain-containing protein [Planctomycetota bacterium]|nr:MAG: PilZ domain-containing protein [Planctomycetota bacterium]
MKTSHRLRIISSQTDRKRRVVLPPTNKASLKKKGWFREEDLGEVQKIINISEGGMQIFARGDVEVGDKIVLELDFRELEIITPVEGRVKWKKPVPREIYYLIGIEFTKVPPSVQKKLTEITNDPLVVEYESEKKEQKDK